MCIMLKYMCTKLCKYIASSCLEKGIQIDKIYIFTYINNYNTTHTPRNG
jgi:hypothetical protein